MIGFREFSAGWRITLTALDGISNPLASAMIGFCEFSAVRQLAEADHPHRPR